MAKTQNGNGYNFSERAEIVKLANIRTQLNESKRKENEIIKPPNLGGFFYATFAISVNFSGFFVVFLSVSYIE